MSSVNPASAHELPGKRLLTIKLPTFEVERVLEVSAKMIASSITPTCLPVFGHHLRQQQFATWFIRTFHLSCRFPLERILLNAYYIEDLKYVNRRLSIPSGLFSPPTEESTFDPRTQPTSSLPPSPPPPTLVLTNILRAHYLWRSSSS